MGNELVELAPATFPKDRLLTEFTAFVLRCVLCVCVCGGGGVLVPASPS